MIVDYVTKHSLKPRLERKYYLPATQSYILKSYITLASGALTEIYHQRKINNIYFDTSNLAFFQDNLIGAQNRLKARLRWYGDGSMKNPNLEIKMKISDLIYKLVTPYDGQLSLPIQELMKRLKPSIKNSYYRKYYLTHDKKVRLTVDTEIMFDKVMSPKTVVELKYAVEDEKMAVNLINQFPLLLQKNSKYVDGIASNLV
jgi:SPX domain protein involved in polyphosphate accumulation